MNGRRGRRERFDGVNGLIGKGCGDGDGVVDGGGGCIINCR